VWIPPSLLRNGCVNTFPRKRIHVTTDELLDASFSVLSFSYRRRVCVSVYPQFECMHTEEVVCRLPEPSDSEMVPVGLGTKHHCAGTGQQQFTGLCIPVVPRQRLCKHVTAVTLNSWRLRFLCGHYPYQRKVGN
jgi:hypothetical protein